MLMRRLSTAGAAAALGALLAACAVPAAAQVYVGVDGGFAWANDAEFNLPTTPNPIHPTAFESGTVVALRAGYRFASIGMVTPRLELEYAWRENDVSSFGGQGDVGPGTGTLKLNGWMVNALVDFRFGSRLVPYLGLGFGSQDAKANDIRKDISRPACCTGIINGSDSSGAWQAIVGAAFEATPHIAVTLDYRYLQTTGDLTFPYRAGCLPDGSACSRLPGQTSSSYTSQTLALGLRYTF